MSAYHIVVCGGIAPDPLQRLEPMVGPTGPLLKNEMMLPAVLDPWAASALYEACDLAKKNAGSKVYLVSLGPKAKLQQVLMVLAQKVGFEFVVLDGPAGGFTDSFETAQALAYAIKEIPGIDLSKLLLFGGWESATRGSGTTMQLVGEFLGISEQFQGADKVEVGADGSLKIWERAEGGKHLVSTCGATPVVVGWATGELPEPPNNPQAGMANMRTIMPALAKAKSTPVKSDGLKFTAVNLPAQTRETKIVKDVPEDEIAKEIVAWVRGA